MPGSYETGNASMRVYQYNTTPREQQKKPKLTRCCTCGPCLRCICGTYSWCICFLLFVVGVAAYVFWPRPLTVCLHYGDATATVKLALDPSSSVNASADGAVSATEAAVGAEASAALPGATATVEFVAPFSTNNSNLWGLSVDSLRVAAYYSGNRDVAIARGNLDSFNVVAQGASEFDVVLTPEEDQAANIYTYLTRDCGPLLTDGASWPLDLHVELSVFFLQNLSFWMENLSMPCATVTPTSPSLASWQTDEPSMENATNPFDDECNDPMRRMAAEWPPGQYCKSLLCAIDDLMCEAAANATGSACE